MPSDDEIRAILRDPVDAVNDAELLAIVLRHRFDAIQSEALAAIAIRRARNT